MLLRLICNEELWGPGLTKNCECGIIPYVALYKLIFKSL